MDIDTKYINQFVNVTSKAALASYYFVGKNDKIKADKAAVDSMRNELNKLDISGKVVIGEGELDEAPMLFIGEKLGTFNGPQFDIAVDPLEGTNFVAQNLPGAMSVIAVSGKNNLFNAPETYMEKISARVSEVGVVDLDYSIKKNISNLADFKNTNPSSLNACVLDRPRHKKIINDLKELNVNIKLITDGDVAGALLVTKPSYHVDIFLGIGGGPEGVLAAAALDAYDCHFQGRFIFENEKDIKVANEMGINDLNKKYELNEIIQGDSIFCATAITDTMSLKGIMRKDNNTYLSETLVTHKSSGDKGIIKKQIIVDDIKN